MIRKYRNTGGSFSRRILPAPKNFIQLDDCPPNYTGAASKFVTVKAGENGLEFTALPPLAITDTFVVASQAAMLALTAQTGDVAIRTDINQTFILQGTDPSILSHWVLLLVSTPGPAGGDLAGTYPNPEVLKASKSFSFTGIIYDTIAAQKDDYNPIGLANASTIQLTLTGPQTITGIAGGTAGRILIIQSGYTGSTDKLTLKNNSGLSAAGNRFYCPLSADFVLSDDNCVILQYDAVQAHWIVISTNQAPYGDTTNTICEGNDSRLFPQFQFFADQFRTPLNSDFLQYGANAATIAEDSLNPAILERQFNDTTAQYCAFDIMLPPGATNIIFDFTHRAQTAPGTVKNVALCLYQRQISDNAAPGAWSAKKQLKPDLAIPTNTNWQYDTATYSLSSLGLTAGLIAQIEFGRDAAEGTDDLVNNWNLMVLKIRFS